MILIQHAHNIRCCQQWDLHYVSLRLGASSAYWWLGVTFLYKYKHYGWIRNGSLLIDGLELQLPTGWLPSPNACILLCLKNQRLRLIAKFWLWRRIPGKKLNTRLIDWFELQWCGEVGLFKCRTKTSWTIFRASHQLHFSVHDLASMWPLDEHFGMFK